MADKEMKTLQFPGSTDVYHVVDEEAREAASSAVKTVNGQAPDETGNVQVAAGVGGTTDYNSLANRPSIEGVTLTGNKTLDELGAVKVAQGTEAANKFLGTDENGNVVIKEVPDSAVTVDDTLTKSGQAADAAVVGAELRHLSSDISAVSDKVDVTDTAREIIFCAAYPWVAGYFDVNGHFNGAYYYRIAINKWFPVTPGAYYAFDTHSDYKFLIRGYDGTTGYNIIGTLVSLQSKCVIKIPENVTYITITISADETTGDSTSAVNDLLKAISGKTLLPTVTKLAVAPGPNMDITEEGVLTGDFIAQPPSAEVGQTIRVSAIDENGKPTAWEVVDFPAGGEGTTPNLQIGTVTTLESGSAATASITGTAENPLLNLGIPKGPQGADYVLTEADKTEIAEQAAALVDAALLNTIGTGEII